MLKRRLGIVLMATTAVLFCLTGSGICQEDIPSLDVNGIFLDAKSNYAIVNDAIVKEGETVNGVTVGKITKDEVQFKYKEQEFSKRLSKGSQSSSYVSSSVADGFSASKKASAVSSSVADGFSASKRASGSKSYTSSGYKSKSSSGSTSMKTIYGIPTDVMFPGATEEGRQRVKEQMMQAMPPSSMDPGAALQQAMDAKVASETKKAETLKQIEEMEGY